MANFDIAADIVLGHEGGYQANPADRGNYNSLGQNVGTNWGISAKTYESWIKRPPSMAEMKAMQRDMALVIYKTNFWDRTKGDQVADQQLANIAFDGAVNHGVNGGNKMLQRACNDLGSILLVDGIIGPLSLAAINGHDPNALHDAYKERRRQKYLDIVANDASQSVFLNGWLRRLDSFVYVPTGDAPLATGGGKNPYAPRWWEWLLWLLVLAALVGSGWWLWKKYGA